MDKQNFVKLLKDGTTDKQQKIEVCQWFINNYAVKIQQIDPFNPFVKQEIWTKLINKDSSEIEINSGSDKAVDYAFQQLQTKLKIFEDGVDTV